MIMNILVCFNAVPKLNILSDTDWVVQEGLKIDTSFVQKDLNPFDESALEIALRFSDHSKSLGLPCSLTAVAVGEEHLDRYLKKLLALKFDNVVRIHSSEDLRFIPETIAHILSNFISKQDCFDIIITGQQSGEGDNAMTPLLLSEYLHWPCISQVVEIGPDTERSLAVKSEIDGAILNQKVKTPLVLSIGNSPCSYLRNPTLKDIAEFGKRDIKIHTPKAFSHKTDKNIFNIKSLKKIDNSRQGIIIEGDTPEDKAKILYESYIKEKL